MWTGCQNCHPAGVCTYTGTKATLCHTHTIGPHTPSAVLICSGDDPPPPVLFNAAPPERGLGMQRVVCSPILVYLKLSQIHVICQ